MSEEIVFNPSAEGRVTYTPETIVKLQHLRGGKDGKEILPQPIEFGIYPRELDVQIEVTKSMIDTIEDGEAKDILKESLRRYNDMRFEQPIYKGFFRPIKEGEWSEYVMKKITDRHILKEHLVKQDGTTVFANDGQEYIKDIEFTKSAIRAIREASGLSSSLREQIEVEKERVNVLLKKAVERMMSKIEKVVNQEQALPSGISSPDTSTTSDGRSQSSPDSKSERSSIIGTESKPGMMSESEVSDGSA